MAELDNNGAVIKVLAFDFDWFGVEGEARYLVAPNMELCGGAQRPEGVKLGHPVLHTHDLQTAQLSFVPASLHGKRLYFQSVPHNLTHGKA